MARSWVWLFISAILSASLGGASPRLPSLQDDTTCSIPEEMWYRPENHHSELVDWMNRRQEIGQRVWDCIDVFGASGKVAQVWKDHGYSATSYDIKLTRQHDICTQHGFKCLLSMGLGLTPNGVMVCAPPCSLFGPACSSIHKRTEDNPAGDFRVFKVRLAQRVWMSFALAIKMIADMRPDVYYVFEQPSGSWGFKQTFMLSLMASLNMFCVCTWMGMFGHDLHKCSHLQTNLRTVQSLRRTMTNAHRRRISERFQRRQDQRAVKKVYHKKTTSASGKKGWQGGPDLASSAEFTPSFCRALLRCWVQRDNILEPERSEDE